MKVLSYIVDILNLLYYLCAVDEKTSYSMAEKIGIDELCVKEILKERGLKMKELAVEIGITPESLTRALQGNPQFSTLKKIADYLGVPVRNLFKGEDAKGENNDIKGCIFSGKEVLAFNNLKDLENILMNEKKIVYIPSLPREDIYKAEIKEFLSQSINQNASGAKMLRYKLNKVFALTYDASSQRVSLTQCIGKGKIRFKLFDVEEYLSDGMFSIQGFNRLLESIHSEIES